MQVKERCTYIEGCCPFDPRTDAETCDTCSWLEEVIEEE